MYSLYFLGIIINLVGAAPKCQFYFDSSEDAGYNVVRSSKLCKDILQNEWRSFQRCGEKLVAVSLYTQTVFPTGTGFLPHIVLNMSATLFEPTEAIFFFYTCLNAPDQSDNYCHDNQMQLTRYGEIVEPCRGFQLNDTAATFRADVNCFRVYGLSEYVVNVVLLPQRCRSEVFLTMPLDYRYDPRIHHVFDKDDPQGLSFDSWSPFLFVDTMPKDGVWVRYQKPPEEAKVLEMNLNLYSKDGDKTKLVRREVVKASATGLKVQNLEKGEYLVVGYVKRHNCQLHCNKEDGCEVCHHTMLNFTLTEDKFTPAWRRVRPLVNAARSSMAIFIVIFALLCITAGALVVYIKFVRPKIFNRRPAQQFELQATPKVLIVYSDDSETHSEAVAQLAHFLTRYANAEVHLDQFDLCDTDIRPSVWLQQNIEDCSHVVVVFSDAFQYLSKGRQMRQRRPYPDMFNAALHLVITAVSRITSTAPMLVPQPQNGCSSTLTSLSKFVVVQFDYSVPEVIPDFFNLARCKSFTIPVELKLLVAHLHNVDATLSSLEYQVETGDLERAVRGHVQFTRDNPRWLEERFLPAEEVQNSESQIPEAPVTNQSLQEMGQKLGVFVPEDSDEEQEPTAGMASRPQKLEELPLILPDQINDSDDES
ncbi:unnamed protein product [Bursaphelenchus xylophilus]|uniref:(pine wood nematode) hypothetical protein n=1 Tax=Bursaphelenchus xylophilus TaxID=6326 RepID=A0A1I7RW99_BURXY|nr:unnamed protein product [Bursaphelenchus xylophilus]CAG9095337.1 unnamed protein product [Bursaphelenchus xylophilus]